MACLLGIDIGTSGARAVLFDETGRALGAASREYPMDQPKNGWAEQDAKDWWTGAAGAVREALSNANVRGEDVCGIGLSGQMHGLTMLDKHGEPLRPAIIWCDQRTQKQCDYIEDTIGHDRLIAITANPALTGFTAGKLLWVREHQPDIYDQTAHVLLPKDYVRYRLTGEYATEVSDAGGMQLLDVPARAWSSEVLDKLHIDQALLARVFESSDVTGVVSEQAARETGLKAGTPVAGGAGDNAAAAVGTGVCREGRAFTTIGTSGVVFAHTDKVTIDPKGRVHTFPCAVKGAWHVMGVTQAAGLSLKWYRDAFMNDEKNVAEGLGEDSYVLLNRQIERVPVGARGVYYLPYLMGERTPHLDAEARGAFIGLSAMHTKYDMLRAVMEGVSYSLKDCLSVFDEMHLTVNDMAMCGGGARSPIWAKMLASLYGCPVHGMQSSEGAALGAALLGGVAAGVYKDVPEACDAAVKPAEATMPDAAASADYAPRYETFRALYPALRACYARMASTR